MNKGKQGLTKKYIYSEIKESKDLKMSKIKTNEREIMKY